MLDQHGFGGGLTGRIDADRSFRVVLIAATTARRKEVD
jgi:hypothetical protein